MLVENGHQYTNTQESVRAKQIKLVHESIDAVLAQVKCILISIVNVENTTRSMFLKMSLIFNDTKNCSQKITTQCVHSDGIT